MNENDIDLRSVNWQYGMLVAPEHMESLERYIDSNLLWVLRYCTQVYGLTGAGPRMKPSERGAAKYDPLIDIYEDEEILKVSVSQCRGLTPSGDIIDIEPSHPVHGSVGKNELEGMNELGVYVVCEPHDKSIDETLNDPRNPQMKAWRHRRYQVKLGISAAQEAYSLMLARLRKSDRSLRYEKVAGFIPVCTSMVGHSELTRAWHQLNDEISRLADRYTELHKAILEYIQMAEPRGINTAADRETMQFIDRMVVTLEICAHEVLDPTQSPPRFFQQMNRAIRSAAVYLDLSPPTRDYFRHLSEVGETEFDALLAQNRQTLTTSRELTIHSDLGLDVQHVERGLLRLRRLEEALEGKYLDFRVSPALEALNFFFDRQIDALFQSTARPARPQTFRNELTFVFAPLNLEGRQKYRLVLIGTSDSRFERGDSFEAEIRLNEGAGQSSSPIYATADYRMDDQRNFAIDFDVPPEIHTISDLRVTIGSNWQIKSCMLYVRRFLQPGAGRLSTEPPLEEPEPDVKQGRRFRPIDKPQERPGPSPKQRSRRFGPIREE